MNDLCQHEEHVSNNPFDRTAARALLDHHEEALGVTHEVAVRAVAAMLRQWKKWADKQEAERLLSKDNPHRENLMTFLVYYARMKHRANIPVILSGRWQPPRRRVVIVNSGSGRSRVVGIEVGVCYVLWFSRRLTAEKFTQKEIENHRDKLNPHPANLLIASLTRRG